MASPHREEPVQRGVAKMVTAEMAENTVRQTGTLVTIVDHVDLSQPAVLTRAILVEMVVHMMVGLPLHSGSATHTAVTTVTAEFLACTKIEVRLIVQDAERRMSLML